ncbi:MAG: T9SS type A sorting domain-containing protein [Candidatus Marinimicrobia bacterium]|nr:T9SS type A sorting domain-containing protein [Candidatus Neomarinimicrobiota bacterium]MCF7828715.1 T9SS type A sorting domain-containing protein [Candidatus Neomarinimicrobiota bacterium]MCF7880456.1 T9SS type A sorting domain-containing protein [Candidatus Neomarinimicrobiota bacterium]
MKWPLMCLSLVIFAMPLSAQSNSPLIRFIPATDTVRLYSGCLPPMMTYSVYRDSAGPDSVIFQSPYMSYVDSTGNWQSTEQSMFLIADSSAQWKYTVWYEPIDTLHWLYDSAFVVPPDSQVEFIKRFWITLIAESDSDTVDSLSQLFYGHQAGIGVAPKLATVEDFTLHPNYPNPFNSHTLISYTLQKAASVNFRVYNMQGQLCWSRETGVQPPGRYQTAFSSRDLPSGMYLFRLETPTGGVTQKWLIIK